MLLGREVSVLLRNAIKTLRCVTLFLLVCVPGLSDWQNRK